MNHVEQIASIDFFTVPTVTIRVLFVFVVLLHARRKVVHFGVAECPTQEWTMQQLREAFPWDRRRDPLGKIPSRNGWLAPSGANGWTTSWCGTADRCVELCNAISYYESCRTHLSLAKDAPLRRPVQPPALGKVIEIPQVGGLHHLYLRKAA